MIRFVLYALLFAGIYILYCGQMKKAWTSMGNRSKARIQKEVKSISAIKRMLKSLNPEWNSNQLSSWVILFLLGSIMLLLFCLVLLCRQGVSTAAICVSLFMGMLPYLYLRVKLMNRQITGSYEGEMLLVEILNQYKIHHLNAREAIDRSIPYLDKAPVGRRLLFQLSMRLKTCQSDRELQELLNEFAVSSNTQWARMLSTNLYYACSADINITAGLEDLLKECEYTKKMIEDGKRQNNEAYVMIRFLAPAVYLVLMWSLVSYMDLTISELVHYQLFTSSGALFFIVILLAFFACSILAEAFSRPKFDV